MDEKQQQQFESMKQELALLQLNYLKRFDDLEKSIKSIYIGFERITNLENRIETLESVRSRQIQINTQLLEHIKHKISSENPQKRSFWELFK